MSDLETTSNAPLTALQVKAAVVGLVFIVLAGIGASINRDQFINAYFFSYLFVLGIALGSLGIVMLHHMTGGDWGYCNRRICEASAMTMPLLTIAFIPIWFGRRHLFPWANEDIWGIDHVLKIQHDRWLNDKGIFIRAIIYFAIWNIWAMLMWMGAKKHDRTGDPWLVFRMQRWSALGLLLYVVTMSLAAVDWIQAREAHWYSTIIGLVTVVGQTLSAMVLALAVLRVARRTQPLGNYLTPPRINDLASLMLAFVILWAYMSFAQLLIIWMGNTATDSPWYIRRGFSGDPGAPHGWQGVALLLIVCHFFVPFFVLLIKSNKRNLGTLSALAIMMLLMRVIDLFWWVGPSSLLDRGSTVSWLIPRTPTWQDFVLPPALFGLWLACMLVLLKSRPLLARVEEGPDLEHGASHHAHASA